MMNESHLLNLLFKHSGDNWLLVDSAGVIFNSNHQSLVVSDRFTDFFKNPLGKNIYEFEAFKSDNNLINQLKEHLSNEIFEIEPKVFTLKNGFELLVQAINYKSHNEFLFILNTNKGHSISNEIFSKIAASTSDALMVTNDAIDDTKILYVNDAFVALTGYTFEEIENKSPKVLQGELTSKKVLKQLKNRLKENKGFKGSTYNYKKNGEPFINSWEIKKISNSAGQSFYLTIINDVTEQESIKINLKSQESKLKMMFEVMAEGIVFQDNQGIIIEHNKAAEDLLGLTYNQIIGRDSFDSRWKALDEFSNDYPGEKHPISRSRLYGEIVNNSIMGIHTPEGNLRWLSVNSRPTINEKGEQIGAFCTFHDISQEINAKNELVNSEKRYRTIFEDNPNPLILTDASQTHILSVNKAAESFYGYSKSKFENMHFSDLDITKNNTRDTFYLDSDKIHKTKNRIVYVSIKSKQIELEKIPMVIHQVNDVTNRRLAEFKLLKQERRITDITRNTEYAVFEIDNKFRFTLIFGAILETVKLKSEDIVGLTVLNFADKHSIEIDPLLSKKHQNNGSFTFQFRDQTLKCDYSTIMQQNLFGGYRGVITNITSERKLKNELLEVASELKQAQSIANIGSWSFNIKTNKGFWTAMAKSIFGMEKESVLDVDTLKDLLNRLSKHQKSLLQKDFHQLKKTKSPINRVLKVENEGLQPKWVQLIAAFQETNENELYGTVQDVTREKKASEERIRLEQIVKHITNEVIVFSIDELRPIYSNIAANYNLGYSAEEMKDLTIDHFIHEFDDINFVEEILLPKSEDTIDTQQLLLKFKRKDGSIYDSDCTIQKLLANDEMVIVIIANDVTELILERKRKRLINDVNEIIVSAKKLYVGIDNIISCLCQHLDFDGGGYYEFDLLKEFKSRFKWSELDLDLQDLIDNSHLPDLLESISLEPNQNILYLKKGDFFPSEFISDKSAKQLPYDLIILSFTNNRHVRAFICLFSKLSKQDVFDQFSTPLKNVDGQVEQFINAKEGETQLINSLKEKEILLKEIHHRVKNNLQTVSSLLYLKSHEINDPSLVNFLTDTQKRISAISFTHEKLLKSNEFKYLDSRYYFEDLIYQISSTHHALSKVDFKYDIDSIMLETDVIMNMGLIINEIITNSLKHAFIDKEEGNIEVKLSLKSPNLVNLFIRDDGKGLEESKMDQSTGMQLIEIFVEQLNGKMEMKNSQGLSFSIDFNIKEHE